MNKRIFKTLVNITLGLSIAAIPAYTMTSCKPKVLPIAISFSGDPIFYAEQNVAGVAEGRLKVIDSNNKEVKDITYTIEGNKQIGRSLYIDDQNRICWSQITTSNGPQTFSVRATTKNNRTVTKEFVINIKDPNSGADWDTTITSTDTFCWHFLTEKPNGQSVFKISGNDLTNVDISEFYYAIQFDNIVFYKNSEPIVLNMLYTNIPGGVELIDGFSATLEKASNAMSSVILTLKPTIHWGTFFNADPRIKDSGYSAGDPNSQSGDLHLSLILKDDQGETHALVFKGDYSTSEYFKQFGFTIDC